MKPRLMSVTVKTSRVPSFCDDMLIPNTWSPPGAHASVALIINSTSRSILHRHLKTNFILSSLHPVSETFNFLPYFPNSEETWVTVPV